jgi:aromatic ring hydroxylase
MANMTIEEFLERQKADPTPETIARYRRKDEIRRQEALRRCLEAWKPYFELKKLNDAEREAIQNRVFEKMLKEAEGAPA